jgi:hypothetical protein
VAIASAAEESSRGNDPRDGRGIARMADETAAAVSTTVV